MTLDPSPMRRASLLRWKQSLLRSSWRASSVGRLVSGGLLAAGLFAVQSPAMAQVPTETFTDSFAEAVAFNPATVTVINIANFTTQIIGKLAGGVALYDQTFAFAFTDPITQAGVTAARLAITTAGGPGVIIGAPVLTASSTNTNAVSNTIYSLAGTASSPQTLITFGPATIQIGQLTVCSGIGALPGPGRPTCGPGAPTPYAVGDNETNYNTVTTTNYTVDQNTQTTNTTTLFEQYTITGVVQALGRVHALAPGAIGEQGERFSQRLRDEAGEGGSANTSSATVPGLMSYVAQSNATLAGRPGVMAGPGYSAWINGFGWHGRRSGAAGVPGDTRRAAGVEGGFAGDLTETLRIGFGLDYSQMRLSLKGAGESAQVDLTQAGLFAGWRNGPWYIVGAATAGFGDVSTASAVPGLGVSSGSYNARVFSLSSEAGYRFNASGWRLTPHVGAEWRQVNVDAFTEAGALALVSPGGDFNTGKFWAGVRAARTVEMSAMALSFGAYARLVGYTGSEAAIPVTFAAAPGVPLVVTAPKLGDFGLETGFAASLAISANADLYASYDLRLRENLVVQTGLAGLRVRW